ncbi:hypothetical protein BsWGS_10106 [Bradybaena similaris]
MSLHSLLSSVQPIISVTNAMKPNYSALSLLVFPSNLPVDTTCSSCLFLIISPKNTDCLLLMRVTSSHEFVFLNTSSLRFLSLNSSLKEQIWWCVQHYGDRFGDAFNIMGTGLAVYSTLWGQVWRCIQHYGDKFGGVFNIMGIDLTVYSTLLVQMWRCNQHYLNTRSASTYRERSMMEGRSYLAVIK